MCEADEEEVEKKAILIYIYFIGRAKRKKQPCGGKTKTESNSILSIHSILFGNKNLIIRNQFDFKFIRTFDFYS